MVMADTVTERVSARYKRKKEVDSEDGGKTTVYEYSDRQIAKRNNDKAKRLEKLRTGITGLRSQMAKDLKSSDPDKFLSALAVGLMDETYERVGNPDSASDGHFGVTGWKKKHVSFGRGTATISYVGKSGVRQKKKVRSKALVKALRDAYEGCDGDDLFCHGEGTVGADSVNSYLEKFDISAKDIRGYHANDVMKAALKAGRKGTLTGDPKERKTLLKAEWLKALDATAAAVGHESSTLRSQYLVPGLEDTYMKDGTVFTELVKKTAARYSRSKCMGGCGKAPDKAVVWADGRGRAWFCKACFPKWRDEDPDKRDIIREVEVEGEVPKKFASASAMAHRLVSRVEVPARRPLGSRE